MVKLYLFSRGVLMHRIKISLLMNAPRAADAIKMNVSIYQ